MSEKLQLKHGDFGGAYAETIQAGGGNKSKNRPCGFARVSSDFRLARRNLTVTPALGFRAAAALAPLEKCGLAPPVIVLCIMEDGRWDTSFPAYISNDPAMNAKSLLTLRIGLALLALMLLPQCHKAGPSAGSQAEEDSGNLARVQEMYADYKESFPDVEDIDPEKAMRLARAGKAVLVDVRTKEEQKVSMLPEAIRDTRFLEDSSKYEEKTVIGYCTISYRSGILAEKLADRGISMLNLRGGILAWVHEGGKVYHQGETTKRVHVYGTKWNLLPPGYEAVW